MKLILTLTGLLAILITSFIFYKNSTENKYILRSIEKVAVEYGRQNKIVHDMKVEQFNFDRDRAAAKEMETFKKGLQGYKWGSW